MVQSRKLQMKEVAERAKSAAETLAFSSESARNRSLLAMAALLKEKTPEVVKANLEDTRIARESGLPEKIVARLGFKEGKVRSRIDSLERIAALPDPLGREFGANVTENGMEVHRVSVPLGVILMIYEARPHVTVNAGAFCLKSGNAAILRGGSEAKNCNALLGALWRRALTGNGLPRDAIQVIDGPHQEVDELLAMDDLINLVIPRGGKSLIMAVSEKSRIPVIKHFEGICHVFLDAGVDLSLGIDIALDSKCLMPEVCNAMETLIVHRGLSPKLGEIVSAFRDCGVSVRGCEATRAVVADVAPATEMDWRTEYLDLMVSIRVVDSVEAAIDHINTFGSHHTDSIVTRDERSARAFAERVDSAVVLVNASTMFCDGKSLGMGAEIGISTDKIHARGPMGLSELTSYKFVIRGTGQVMGGPGSFRRRVK